MTAGLTDKPEVRRGSARLAWRRRQARSESSASRASWPVRATYNDWLAPGDDDTPPELLATAYWAHDAALMAEIAQAIGRPEDARGYEALPGNIAAAFAGAHIRARDTRLLNWVNWAAFFSLAVAALAVGLAYPSPW